MASIKNQYDTRQPFLWGAATAAHQVEGGNHNQWTEWEARTATQKVKQAVAKFSALPMWPDIQQIAMTPGTYISGATTDHYHRYEEDFDMLIAMNMNAYRFSIEWSRIEPREGEWDSAEVEHYRQYISALRTRGIEPIVTLFHFTLPVWFVEKGGFEKRKNVRYFVRYAEKIVAALGTEFRYLITINEPEVYVQQGHIECNFPPQSRSFIKAFKVFNNLAHAHNRAARAIRNINSSLQISLAKNSARYVAGDESLRTKLSMALRYYIRDDYFLRRVIKQCDFLGVNYYFSNRIVKGRVDNTDAQHRHDLGWKLVPGDIEHVLVRLYNKYNLPIMITENGLADRQDVQRKWWIEQTLMAMERAESQRVPLLGYLHWSLLDNFEWGFGNIPRFGLAEVEYPSLRRTLRPSALWFRDEIQRRRQ